MAQEHEGKMPHTPGTAKVVGSYIGKIAEVDGEDYLVVGFEYTAFDCDCSSTNYGDEGILVVQEVHDSFVEDHSELVLDRLPVFSLTEDSAMTGTPGREVRFK